MTNELSRIDTIVEGTFIEDAIEFYDDHPVLQYLLGLLPLGKFAGKVITRKYNNILRERTRTFFDELKSGEIALSNELIQKNDFLHSFYSSYSAVLNTKQKEKIRFFARLLKNNIQDGQFNQSDVHDDYLKILDELSYRELFMLHTLKKYEATINKADFEGDPDYDELRISGEYWYPFCKDIYRKLSVERDELRGLLARLIRTGCYSEFVSMTLGYDGGQGKTTAVFSKLVLFVEMKDEDFVYYRKSADFE